MQKETQALCDDDIQQTQGDGYACPALQHHVYAAVVWIVVIFLVACEISNLA